MTTTGEAVGIVRQPLFDDGRRVLGYEIRSEASVDVADVEALTGGARAWVHVTRQSLIDGDIPAGLPAGRTVVQLPAGIDAAPEVRDACADLRRRDYRVALDRVGPEDDFAPLLPYADYVSAPVRHLSQVMTRPAATVRRRRPPAFTAVDVHSYDEFDAACAAGSAAVQGDFIARPRLTARSNIPAAQFTWLRLVRALQDPDLSVIRLEELVKPDAAFCLRVMRAVNGAAFAQATRITSLRQALLLVGAGTVRDWATAWMVRQLGSAAPSELVAMASIRGRFCELLSRGALASTGGDGFLLGMCSLLDAILESPMDAILDHLPLCESNDAALRGVPNSQRGLLDAAIAWERGAWEGARIHAAGAGIDPSLLPGAYREAVTWMARVQEPAVAA